MRRRSTLDAGKGTCSPEPATKQPPTSTPAPANRILEILQHALGRNKFGHNPNGGPDYRNHFCAGGGDLATCREAVSLGLMVEHEPRAISGGDPIFTVTDAGKAYVAEHSPPEPKLTPGQKRYRAWLRISDVYDVSFGQWLKDGAR